MEHHNIIVVEKKPELTPEEFTGLEVSKPSDNAVGFPAIISSVQHAMQWMDTSDVVKTMFKINQKGGFDCPGCAWPDPDDDRSSLGEYCENGMKAIAEEATNKRITSDFFKKYSVQQMANWSDYEIGKKGRLTEPMYLAEGATHYESISWEKAFELMASELNALASPDEAIFYTSGRTSNEAAFMYQLFVREFGTNNLPDCSNMCHESSGKALNKTLGIGKGSVTLHDLHVADLIIVIGQNPGTNHPRMLSALEKNKENGGTIIAINPLPEAGLMHFTNPQSPIKMLKGGVKLADLFLQVRINGDVALLKAILLLLLQEEEKNPNTVFDYDFIQTKTIGYEDFIHDLKKYNFDELVKESSVEEKYIRSAAQLCIEKKNIIICWAMGLTQHKNAVGNIQELVNLLLLKGSIGKEGAGTCPVRGHSNVQGDRTMGIWEAPKTEFLDQLEKVFDIKAPRKHGYDVVSAIEAMHAGEAKVFFALGGNFLSATPDTSYTADALRRCHLTVHVSTKLNRSHLVHGKKALILPCLGRTDKDLQASGEQFVTVENSMGIVHSSRGVLSPCSEQLLSEPAIVAQLAQAVFGKKSKTNWKGFSDDYANVRAAIEQTIKGFENYNERIKNPEGFYLPNGARQQKFNTASGKAHFTINEVPQLQIADNEFIMMTIRTHDQYNTTIYGLHDRYRGIHNERRVILMNEKDMTENGLKMNDVVHLYSHFKGVKREAKHFIVVPYDIPTRCTATYFPETNTLVPIDSFADESRTPTSKMVLITMEKV